MEEKPVCPRFHHYCYTSSDDNGENEGAEGAEES